MFSTWNLVGVNASFCVGALLLARRKARTLSHPLDAVGHLAQFCRLAAAKPQTPTLVAIKELICTQPTPKVLCGLRFLLDEGVLLSVREKVIAIIDGLVTNADLRDSADWR